MAINLDITNSYYMMGLWQGLTPAPTFFKDRYFETTAADIYKADKVLVEYRDGDRQMAPFMVDRAEPIAVARNGYEITEYSPVKLGNKAPLTIDDLKIRGFGEAILPNATWAERANRLISDDLNILERRFQRAEEWLCAQTMINNGFTVTEMIDADTAGGTAEVKFYNPAKGNDGLYTISVGGQWTVNTDFRAIVADVRAMCRQLSQRGLPATDLVIGQDVADVLLANKDFQALVNLQSGINIAGGVRETLSAYDGVTFIGTVNFGGHNLNVISVDEQYTNAAGTTANYFPAKSVLVSAPRAGHLMYAQITVMHEDGEFDTIAAPRVPSVFIDRRHKTRELWLESRPFAAPKNYSPWVYAANVVA